MKNKIQEIENLSIKGALNKLIKCLEKETINLHDKTILQEELKLPLDLIELGTKSDSVDNVFHENLTLWQDIFDKELLVDTKLTLEHVKNMLLSFISSATPPIKLHDSSLTPLSLKQSELGIYLKDLKFKEQLDALAENNISAFELLSNLIGHNDFQQSLDAIYFYGFDLSETKGLFEQVE